MNNLIDQLTKSILHKESLEQCTVRELKQLANTYPYFGAAQLLLAKKLQAENSEEYTAQVEKTSLFFNNPFWLDQLLNEKGDVRIERKAQVEIEDEVKKENEIESETKFEMEERSEGTTIPEEVKAIQPGEIKVLTTTVEEPAKIIKEEQKETQAVLSATKDEPFKANTALLFEPYHTVDYFASQGIRFKEEEKPADKLGQQLKSFTEWLKTLKRLPVSEIVKSSEPVAEKKVEQMAEASLAEREVITETMAEVWKKQGNTEKAIEIYNKLSLLEPAKSVYFAAKIEELRK
jgi:hypothetical protein